MEHLRHRHHVRNLSHVLTTSNKCPVCSKIFRNQITAARHLQASLQRGYCGGFGPRSLVPLAEPKTYKCGLCHFAGRNAEDLRGHVLVHLPWPVYLTRSEYLHSQQGHPPAARRDARRSRGSGGGGGAARHRDAELDEEARRGPRIGGE
eukprot:5506452-Pyramimonas_sp.AAC.1